MTTRGSVVRSVPCISCSLAKSQDSLRDRQEASPRQRH